MNYCFKNTLFCINATEHGSCGITACTKITDLLTAKEKENESSDILIPLTSNETPENEFEVARNVSIAENYLEDRFGIKVKTKYGDYRNTYNILKDLGEYLSKNSDHVPDVPYTHYKSMDNDE